MIKKFFILLMLFLSTKAEEISFWQHLKKAKILHPSVLFTEEKYNKKIALDKQKSAFLKEKINFLQLEEEKYLSILLNKGLSPKVIQELYEIYEKSSTIAQRLKKYSFLPKKKKELLQEWRQLSEREDILLTNHKIYNAKEREIIRLLIRHAGYVDIEIQKLHITYEELESSQFS